MTATSYPSTVVTHRRADLAVHAIGLFLITIAGTVVISKAVGSVDLALLAAILVYVACALASNLASWAYHFLPWHDRRQLLRRIDHAAIYPSISGTFTPLFVHAGTTLTMVLLVICWGLTAAAIWNKISNSQVKSRWSTASYLGLGAVGLCAIPDLKGAPVEALWFILAGAFSYVIGVVFYARKSLPFRYAIWHSFVNAGALFMFAAIWVVLF